MKFKTTLFVAFCAVFLPLLVNAQEPEAKPSAEAAGDDDVQHRVSITISPIHLALPIVELTGEYRLADKQGVAVVVGAGSVDDLTAFEVGAQYRYYVLGSFIHGMQIGGELMYVNVDGSEGNVSATGNGVTIGPFVGYKFTNDIGFTIDLQAGAQFVAVRAKATAGAASASEEDSDVLPLLNLNLGWSF